MNTNDLPRRIDELIAQGQGVMHTRRRSDNWPFERVSASEMAGFRSACLSFLQRVFGVEHPYFAQFREEARGSNLSNAESAVAILRAVRAEITGGWIFTIKGLIAAELFFDFMEMADHLLKSGYKDAAAVMTGCVLEEYLHQLCVKHDVPLEDVRNGDRIVKKTDRLNSDLTKADVYNMLEQKQITAWLDLRNNAAHGKYGEYDADQVKLMKAGILSFMNRVPI